MDITVERTGTGPDAAVRLIKVDGAELTPASEAKDLQNFYKTGFRRVQELDGTMNRPAEADAELGAGMDALEAVKGWLGTKNRLDELSKFTQQTTGVPLLAGNEDDPSGARAMSMRPMAHNEIDATRRIREQYGEGEFLPAFREKFGNKEYKDAFHTAIRNANRQESSAYRDASNTLQVGIDSAGGFMVPDDIYAGIVGKKPAPIEVTGNVFQTTTSRDSLTVPTFRYEPGTDDGDIFTSAIRPYWTTEGNVDLVVPEAARPGFGSKRVQVYTAMIRLFVTLEMIEDSMFPIMGYIMDEFNSAVNLTKESVIISGTGISQPAGIITAPGTLNNPAVFPTAASGALDADTVKQVMWNLPAQYDMNAKWFFNKKSGGYSLDTLKDDNKRYLWAQGMTLDGLQLGPGSGGRRPLLGYETLYTPFMPDVTNSAYPYGFGDLTGYWLINRIGFNVQILREKYAEQGLICLLGRLRVGGQLVQPWKLKALQIKA